MFFEELLNNYLYMSVCYSYEYFVIKFYFNLIDGLDITKLFYFRWEEGYYDNYPYIKKFLIMLQSIYFYTFSAEFEIDLNDVGNSFCFNLLLAYYDTMTLIIIILVFVYWCIFHVWEDHAYNLYSSYPLKYKYFYPYTFFGQYINEFIKSKLNKLKIFHNSYLLLSFKNFFPLDLFYLFDSYEVWKYNILNLFVYKQYLHLIGIFYLKIIFFILEKNLKGKNLYYNYSKNAKLNNYLNNINFLFGGLSKPYSVEANKSESKFDISDNKAKISKKELKLISKYLLKYNKNSELLYGVELNFCYRKLKELAINMYEKKNWYSIKKENNFIDIGYELDIDEDNSEFISYNLNKNYTKNNLDFLVNNYFLTFENDLFELDNNLLSNGIFIEEIEKNIINEVFDSNSSRLMYLDEESIGISINENFLYGMSYLPSWIYNYSSKFMFDGMDSDSNNVIFSKRYLKIVSLNIINSLSIHDIYFFFFENSYLLDSNIDITNVNSFVLINEYYILSNVIKALTYNFSSYYLKYESLYSAIRYGNEYRHSIKFEYIWAFHPAFVIFLLIFPAFLLLYSLELFVNAFLIVKILGHQWYWNYEINNIFAGKKYVINFESRLKNDEIIKNVWKPLIRELSHKNTSIELKVYPNGSKRLLDVDKRLIIPAHKDILLIITSTDVLHSYAVPVFGLKVDAVPGRINTFWLNVNKVGVFYGQCSELCGQGHGFMPIVIESQFIKQKKL